MCVCFFPLSSLLEVLALCHCRVRAVPHLHPLPGGCDDYIETLLFFLYISDPHLEPWKPLKFN